MRWRRSGAGRLREFTMAHRPDCTLAAQVGFTPGNSSDYTWGLPGLPAVLP